MEDIDLSYGGSPYREARLTTKYAGNSYAQPVLVVDGSKAYRPGDLLPWGMEAREWVRLAVSRRRKDCRAGAEEGLPEPW